MAKGFLPSGVTVATAGKFEQRDLVLELSRGAIVRGTVYGSRRQPVSGAKLSLPVGKDRVTVVSDGSGAFAFDSVERRRQSIRIDHRDYPVAFQQIELSPTQDELVVRVDLLAGLAIAGRVRDENREPVPWAVVTVHSRGRKLGGTKAGGDGLFETPPVSTTAPDVQLRCVAKGYLPLQQPVLAGQRDVALMLARSARIAGRVVDARTGEPVERFTVRFIGAPGAKNEKESHTWNRSFAGDGGRWDTGKLQLRAGFTTSVEIRAAGYASAIHRDVVARIDARNDELTTELEAGATIRGRVQAGTRPVAGATVKIVPAHNPLEPGAYHDTGHRMARCDDTGRFTFDHVGAGDLHLAVEHPDWGLVLQKVLVPAATPSLEVVVRLDAQATLTGVVIGTDGRAAAKAQVVLSAVQVQGLRYRSWQTRADDSGRFRLERLPPGVYRLARTTGEKDEQLARFVEIQAAKRHSVDLRPVPGARLVGKIKVGGEMPRQLHVEGHPETRRIDALACAAGAAAHPVAR